jgi:hypothetical protein
MFIRYYRFIQIMPLIFILGCASTDELQNISTKEFPVTIFVSNDFTSEPTHISVKVINAKRLKENEVPFDKMIVDQDFVQSILSPKSFKINLKDGSYFFLVETKKGSYKLSVSLEVDKPLWLYLVFVEENNCVFQISSHQFIWG